MSPSSTPSDPDDLLATVRRTLNDHRMLVADDQVLVGVSGGPDSMVLLHLLDRLAPDMGFRLGVAHLNHCLRGASAERDARIVHRAATALGIPCHLGRARVMDVAKGLGLSVEEAARRVRYAFFKKIMTQAGYTKLALGHQLDDNAEQVLMALLRGSGPRGLSGIAPSRQNRIVRPLLRVHRSQIEAYATRAGIPFVTDPSNRDLRFLRNRIRLQLLPELESAYNPRIKDHLGRLAEMMRAEGEWIDGLTAAPYQRTVLHREPGCLILCAETLRRCDPALARRLIRSALQELSGSLRRIAFAHVQSVLDLSVAGSQRGEVHLPRGIRVRPDAGRLVVTIVAGHRRRPLTGVPDSTADIETVVSPPFPDTVEISALGIRMHFQACRPDQLPRWRDTRPNQAFFDADRLFPPLCLRPPHPGDRFTPLGGSGSQKVKKFFIDHHVPRPMRATTPVMLDRERIVWLMGQRIADPVKVTPATTRVLRIEYFLLDKR